MEENKNREPENSGLSEAKSRVLKHWKSARKIFGKSLEEIWLCGQALSEVRDQLLPLGGWLKWLDSEGIPRSTAYYWMKFSREVEFSKIWKYDTVDQAMKAMNPVPPKPKEPAGKVEPDAETEGEASSGTPEEATGGDSTSQLPDDTESPQEVQELRDKLRKTEDQLGKAKEEIERLKELLEENGISWEPPPDDQQEYPPAA